MDFVNLAFVDSDGKNAGLSKFAQMTLQLEKNQYTLITGTCKERSTLDDVRQLAGEIAKFLSSRGVKQACLTSRALLEVYEQFEDFSIMTAFYEGWTLGQYTFDKYQHPANPHPFVELMTDDEAFDDAKWIAKHRAAGVKAARDLCNEPPNGLNPDTYEDVLRQLFDKTEVKVKGYGVEQLEKHQLNGILTVGRGSARPPRLLHLTYHASDEAPHVALVGKGVTFDTGGINAKSGDFTDMKMDMGGSAAVVGAMKLLSDLEAEVNVTALIPTVENVPDGHSFLPSEIIEYKNGKSVHVGNTDAEGRLVLADSLLFAQELGAETVVDIATLTGSVGHALGLKVSGVWSNREAMAEQLKTIGDRNGDPVWPMPLEDAYNEWLESPYADISNVGTSPFGGAIIAALFLQHFVQPKTKWAHIDMANTVQPWKVFGYYTKGASGFGARLLADFVLGDNGLSQTGTNETGQ